MAIICDSTSVTASCVVTWTITNTTTDCTAGTTGRYEYLVYETNAGGSRLLHDLPIPKRATERYWPAKKKTQPRMNPVIVGIELRRLRASSGLARGRA